MSRTVRAKRESARGVKGVESIHGQAFRALFPVVVRVGRLKVSNATNTNYAECFDISIARDPYLDFRARNEGWKFDAGGGELAERIN